MLRFLFVLALFLCFVVPLYRLLKRKTIKIKTELADDDLSMEDRLTAIITEKSSIQRACKEELKSVENRARNINKINNKLKKGI